MKPKIKTSRTKLGLFLSIFSISTIAVSQTQLNSLSDLWNLIDKNNVKAVITPGIYKIDAEQIKTSTITTNQNTDGF